MLYDHALHSICIFTMFHAFGCVLGCWKLCAVRFGLGWTNDVISFNTSHVHAFFMHRYPLFSCWYFVVIVFFYFSLFLSLSRIDYTWYPSANPLCLGTLFVLGHLLLILPPLMFGSMMRKPIRTFQRTSLNVVFIRSATWFYQTFLILFYPLSFTIGDENLSDTRELSHRDHVGVLLQYAQFRYLYTSVCYAYWRYTFCSHSGACFRDTTCSAGIASWLPPLSTFEDELLSLFCETPSSWGERQNTSCSGFVKGPRFLSIVMTFVLYPLCHYNSITELHARFLLSLLKDLSIDCPSHFILSLIDVYRDTTTHDKLIFPSTITQIICHLSIPYPESLHFTIIGAISAVSVQWMRPSFDWSGHRLRQRLLQPLSFHPPSLLLLQLVVWRLRRSWHSFSAWMLALTLLVMSCVRWTPVSVVLHDDKLTLVASSYLPLLLQRRLRTRMLIIAPVMMMMMRIRMLTLPVMKR